MDALPPRIQPLPSDSVHRLRSQIAITSVSVAVEELVCNGERN